jgi:CBS domain-containing protein
LLQDAIALRAHFPSRLRVLTKQSDAVDLKLTAVDPAVKIARWAALASGSDATSTLRRLDDAAAAKTLDADDASSLQDCFIWLTRFRWRVRVGQVAEGSRASDVVYLSEIAPQDRATLRSIAREIAGISRKLRYLSTFT